MNAATLITTAVSAIVLTAPPSQPSYWVEINERNMTDLLSHCRDADLITVDDVKVVFTLYGHKLLLLGIEKNFEMKAKEDPDARVSWAEVVGEFHKCKRLGLKVLAAGEGNNDKKDESNASTPIVAPKPRDNGET